LSLCRDGKYPATAAITGIALETNDILLELKELQRKVYQREAKTQRLEKCVAEVKEKIGRMRGATGENLETKEE
jgi:hypothetical protein